VKEGQEIYCARRWWNGSLRRNTVGND